MKKKFLALVLTLAMVLSLVPATALAAGENSPVTEVSTDANSPVQIKKSINDTGDKLTLEAYLTNEVTQTVSAKPLDIVLVLDQSGSMAYNFEGNTTNKNTERRQYAMKEAVKNFIDKAYSENGTHKMAIVTFSEGAAQLAKWTTVDASGRTTLINSVGRLDDTPSGATNVAAGMQEAQTLLNAQTNSDSQKVVIVFTDGVPTTQSDFDTTVANSAITAAKAMKNAEAVVYTVGIFNGAKPEQLYGDKWNYAINKDIPCTGEEGSYWGGSWLANFFGNNDFDAIDVPAGNRFLNYLSSNFSGATEIGITYGSYHPGHTGAAAGNGWRIDANFTRTASNYYLTATNADGLNSVFEKIIEEISTLEIEAGTDAILSDTLSEYFDLNIPEGATAESAITVKQWNCTGKDNDSYAWMEASEQPTTINVQVTGKKIEVTGFDYTTNAVTKTTSGSGTVYSGSKLVVTIPIKPDTAYTNWEKGSNLYPTNNTNNDNQAGLSNYKNKNGEALPSTLLKESPKAKVTAYTVTYNWENNAPSNQILPTDDRNYIPGQSYTVDNTFNKDTKIENASGSYQFSGWTDPNNGVMGTKDVTIIGSWKHTEPTTPDPTYTLTYDANGGYFDSDTSVKSKAEQIASAGDHALNYTSAYTPTHAQSGDKDVIFLGWSTTKQNLLTKQNVTTTAPNIITNVNIQDSTTTVYAVWGLDEDGNKIPDVFEATIIYKIVNGQWTKDGKAIGSADITATFQLYEQQADHTWKATNKLLRDGSFPDGYTGTAGYTGLGWYRNSDTTLSPSELVRPTTKVIDAVTGAKTVFTYKYAPTTPQTYTVVLHLEGGSYTTTPGTYTANSDGTYQYSVTQTSAVIKPESPSRNNFGFEGWSLSKNAPQTLIAKDATFAILYLEQSGTSGSFDKIDLYAVWEESEPSVTVNKKVETVGDEPFERDKTVARQNDKIVWSVTVTNEKDAPAQVTLTDVMAAGVYTDVGCQTEASAVNWDAAAHSWTATVSPKGSSIYYVCYTVTQDDIPKGKIVNTIVKGDDKDHPINSDPVSTWDTKQLKSATSLSTSDWTTTVTLTLPTVNKATDNNTVNPVVISKSSYVIDKIGNEFTFVPELKLTLKVGDTDTTYTGVKDGDTNTYNFGTANGEGAYPYTVTYIAKNGDTPAQFTWNINEGVYAGTKVTLSYKLKLTTPKTAAGTYGVEDLNGNGQIEQGKTPIYTNESAVLYKDKQEIAVFPKPSVSYTIKGSSGGHGGNGGGTVTIPDDVPTGLNGKDHYAYVVGYPDGMVYPQKNITRAEVATIFFRLLTDETREANMTKSNGYNDMKDGAWYTCAVSTLSKMGIIKGYEDGSFKPDASISRAEFAAIAARFDPDGDKTPATFSDVSSHWAKDEISIAANHGWIKGYEDGSFKPDQKITRAETMTLVNRVLKRLPETKDDLHKDMKIWPDNQKESAWFYLAVQEATNSHYQKLKKDGIHEKWESMRETRDWAALEK